MGERPLELSSFAPACWGDTARLGVDDPTRRATVEYNAKVIRAAATGWRDPS